MLLLLLSVHAWRVTHCVDGGGRTMGDDAIHRSVQTSAAVACCADVTTPSSAAMLLCAEYVLLLLSVCACTCVLVTVCLLVVSGADI